MDMSLYGYKQKEKEDISEFDGDIDKLFKQKPKTMNGMLALFAVAFRKKLETYKTGEAQRRLSASVIMSSPRPSTRFTNLPTFTKVEVAPFIVQESPEQEEFTETKSFSSSADSDAADFSHLD
jgi:hypothetical protein